MSVKEDIKKMEAGELDTIPGDVVHRIVKGENPFLVWREFKNLSLKELSNKSGVSEERISNLETGGEEEEAILLKIATALQVSLEDILP